MGVTSGHCCVADGRRWLLSQEHPKSLLLADFSPFTALAEPFGWLLNATSPGTC